MGGKARFPGSGDRLKDTFLLSVFFQAAESKDASDGNQNPFLGFHFSQVGLLYLFEVMSEQFLRKQFEAKKKFMPKVCILYYS